jgi:hypothetical protein
MSRSLAPGSIRAARLGRYRHTTLEMAGRVIEAIEHRLTIVLKVA